MSLARPKEYGGRTWYHASVHALMDGMPQGRDPIDVVCERAKEMTSSARAMGWSGPPFDPTVLASLESIRVRASDGPMETDALIRALDDGSLEIVWNETSPPTRRNFSICHELGHTLFPDAYEVVRHRSNRTKTVDDELERLCDAAAAEMLMPAEEFTRDLADLDLAADAIAYLARRYAASPEATARRIATLWDRPCAAVILTLRLKPTEERRARQGRFGIRDVGPTLEPKFRVDYAIPSASFSTRFPEHKSVPADSCVYESLTSAGGVSRVEVWSTGKADVSLRVCALRIPSDSEGRARALALVLRQSR